jgi:hypothetical protein
MKIGTAVLLIAMIAVIWPRARYMMQNSRKGSTQEWMNVVFILGLVVLFVLLLMMMV